MNGHDIVETQWYEIAHPALEDCSIETCLMVRKIGMTDRSEVFDARFLQIVQIVAVVDDAHGICLDEADPDGMTEGIGTGVERRRESRNGTDHALDRSGPPKSAPWNAKVGRLFEVTSQEMFRTFAAVALIASFVA